MSHQLSRVLVIGYVWPEPNSSAAGQHILNIMQMCQSNGCQVTFASAAQLSEHRADLSSLGINEQVIALNCESFDHFIEDLQPHIVIFDRFMLEEQFGWRVSKTCPDALKVLDTEDLHFLRNARHQAVKQKRQVEYTDYISDMALREVAAIYRCDISLIISPAEEQLLVSTFGVPQALLQACPLMFTTTASTDRAGFEKRCDFITIGNFRHAPNWDAVLYLKQHIWPLIRRQLSNVNLRIYGAYPPKKATDLHAPDQGFYVEGWAKDAQQVMSHARVCLAPLRFGAGLKGKLAEAMLCGTPSVTTRIGAEGMGSIEHWPGLVVDEIPQAFAQAAIELYQNEASWSLAQQRGYQRLVERFDKAVIQRNVWQKIVEISNNLHAHRQQNFTGLMLQHHHHKSTQYMGQWIEAKNKLPTPPTSNRS